MWDHSKIWRFAVKAKDEECDKAFRAAFHSKQGRIHRRAHWEVYWREDDQGARLIAENLGRAGLGLLATLNARQNEIAQVSKGSTVAFQIWETDSSGVTECSMWLEDFATLYKGGIGTADAALILNYMRGVEDNLRALDPELEMKLE